VRRLTTDTEPASLPACLRKRDSAMFSDEKPPRQRTCSENVIDCGTQVNSCALVIANLLASENQAPRAGRLITYETYVLKNLPVRVVPRPFPLHNVVDVRKKRLARESLSTVTSSEVPPQANRAGTCSGVGATIHQHSVGESGGYNEVCAGTLLH